MIVLELMLELDRLRGNIEELRKSIDQLRGISMTERDSAKWEENVQKDERIAVKLLYSEWKAESKNFSKLTLKKVGLYEPAPARETVSDDAEETPKSYENMTKAEEVF
jgi:hypothetical protein